MEHQDNQLENPIPEEEPINEPDSDHQQTLLFIIVPTIILLVLSISSIWFFSNYKIVIAIEPKYSTPTPITVIIQEDNQDMIAILKKMQPITYTTPITNGPTTALLQEAKYLQKNAIENRDSQQIEQALNLLTSINTTNLDTKIEVEELEASLLYALDVLSGTVYLDSKNITQWKLKNSQGTSLNYPIDFTINNEGIYIIDSGLLYRANYPLPKDDSQMLTLTVILSYTNQVGSYPIKEIVAVGSTNSDDSVFVLDKSSDVYRYQISSQTWHLEKLESNNYSSPDPLYLNLNTYDNRLYLLDSARNQIWRHPPNNFGIGFLPGKLPWLLNPNDSDVSNAIDLAIDGKIYTLERDGTIIKYGPDKEAEFNLAIANNRTHINALNNQLWRPIEITINPEDANSPLYIADAGQRRIVAIDQQNGGFLYQLVAPNNLDFAGLHSIIHKENTLYILAGSHLYTYDLNQVNMDTISLSGQIPSFKALQLPQEKLNIISPNDPLLIPFLTTYDFTMPLLESLLPDRHAVYPGSRRNYRYGVHQGLDIYGNDIGVEVNITTPVYAVADGIVLKADTNYEEMTLNQVEFLLEEANKQHITPPETLAKLNGRQIVIEHKNNVVTRYSHLSGIAPNIYENSIVKKGQLIGYVGLSGTPDGIAGNHQFPHLHFEIRFGKNHQYYLGQWLTIEETRRIFEDIFNVPVRPAYLDFRKK